MVEGTKVSADLYLLFMGWVSQIDLFQICIMEMNNRFSLSHLCHIFMRFSVGNANGEKRSIKVCWRCYDIEVSTKQNP